MRVGTMGRHDQTGTLCLEASQSDPGLRFSSRPGRHGRGSILPPSAPDLGDKGTLVVDDMLMHEELLKYGIAHERALYESTSQGSQ